MTSEQSTAPSYNTGGIELTACQLHEALLMAGTPELGVPFEDRGRVRIFQSETGHSGPGLYCECVDVEEEGCILLDGTSPAIAPPAQAADLKQQQDAARWRAIAPHLSVEWDEDEMLKRWTWIDFKGDALSVPTRSRESYASVDDAMDAVIDNQAARDG